MKYRLKDQELQKKLDEISNGDFSRQIEGHLQSIRGYGMSGADYRLFFGELSGRYEIVNRFSMLLYEHEIEVFEEYDPNDWNNFPEVTPPEGVLMRVEQVQFKTHEEAKGITIRKCAIFRKGEWVDDVVGYPLASIENCRFRPWE